MAKHYGVNRQPPKNSIDPLIPLLLGGFGVLDSRKSTRNLAIKTKEMTGSILVSKRELCSDDGDKDLVHNPRTGGGSFHFQEKRRPLRSLDAWLVVLACLLRLAMAPAGASWIDPDTLLEDRSKVFEFDERHFDLVFSDEFNRCASGLIFRQRFSYILISPDRVDCVGSWSQNDLCHNIRTPQI